MTGQSTEQGRLATTGGTENAHELAGLNAEIQVLHGVEGLCALPQADRQLLAVDAMNDPRAYMVGKRLIEGGKAVTPAQIRETEDLKGLLK